MKRSEAVLKMARFYSIRHCMVEANYITFQEFCSEMLELLEEIGIYPPDTTIEGHECTMWSPE